MLTEVPVVLSVRAPIIPVWKVEPVYWVPFMHSSVTGPLVAPEIVVNQRLPTLIEPKLGAKACWVTPTVNDVLVVPTRYASSPPPVVTRPTGRLLAFAVER